MKSARILLLATVATASLFACGCAQQGGLMSRRSSLGSLKTGLSHLEFENNQLKSEMAELKTINRQVEDRLVQEESANGELKARLDNARTLLSDRSRFGESSEKVTDTALDPEPAPQRRTFPAGSSSKTKRKPPFARIGGRIEPLPSEDEETPLKLPPPAPRSLKSDDQSRSGDPLKWLPISRGASDSTSRRL